MESTPAPTEGVDLPRIEAAVREILLAVGEDPEREGLRETPNRVAQTYAEVFSGLQDHPQEALRETFDQQYHDFLLLRDITLYSMCEHHLVPFMGVAHVGYLPSGPITGLSKVTRLVDILARRPQIQERLTTEIADALLEHLSPRGVVVVLECEHMCLSMRGVNKPGVKTVTSAVRGALLDGPERAEAMRLIFAR